MKLYIFISCLGLFRHDQGGRTGVLGLTYEDDSHLNTYTIPTPLSLSIYPRLFQSQYLFMLERYGLDFGFDA